VVVKTALLVLLVVFSSYHPLLMAYADEFEIFLKGTLQSDTQVYKDDFDNGRFDGSEMNLRLNVEAQSGNTLVVLKTLSRKYLSGAEHDENRLQEAWLKYESNNYDLKIGKQVFHWGKGTFINPTSIVSPKNYRDIIDTTNEEYGLLSIDFKYFFDADMLEVIYIPEFKRSRLPSLNSRWFFELPESMVVDMTNIPVSYQLLFDQSFESRSDNDQFVVRYSNHSNQLDYAFIYHKGIDSLPVFTEEVLLVSPEQADIQINGTYTKFQMVGGDISFPIGKWMTRIEGAYFYTEDNKGMLEQKDDSYIHYVIGFDRSFNNVLFDKDLFFAIEWSQQESKTDIVYESNDLRHLFDKTLFLKTDIEISSDAELLFETLYDFSDKDYLLKLTYEYRVSEYVKVMTSAFVMGGPEESFFGQYKDNNRIQFKLEAYF